ncbi:MAG: PilZ domain-containing protein [Gammaproteobacteria bacterium]|nr:PilZ domain-containing protein [Gammaproteobacteria bacterium]
MDNRLDRRRIPRQPRRETLFAQVAITAAHGTRRTVRCLSADLSGSGVRVQMEEGISVGTVVDLWVRLAAVGRNFLLRGRVRWYDAARREAGIAVVFAEGTDYWEWQATALE